jgi:hypothetical protein
VTTIIDKADHERFVERIRTDFPFFLRALWQDRRLDKVAPLGRVEMDMARWFQNGPRLRGVLGFRGVGKTYFGTAAFSCFRLRQDPNRKILLPSKTALAMREVVGLCREWIDRCWFLEDMAPPPREGTSTSFNVEGARESKQPSIKAIGNEGQLEGNRAHTIIPDDVETKDNVKTFDSREKLAHVINEYVNILYPDVVDKDDPEVMSAKFPSEVIIVGTVKHEDTVYLKMEKRGYVFRTWPQVYPSKAEVKGALGMAPMLLKDLADGRAGVGNPTVPKRFDEKKCKQDMESLPRTEWLMERMLQTNLAIANPYRLKLADLMVMHVDRNQAPIHLIYGQQDSNGTTALESIQCLGFNEDRFYRPARIDGRYAPYTGTKAFLDTSGKGEDSNGLAIIGHLSGFFHVKCCVGLDGGYEERTLDAICALLLRHGARELYVEDNFGGGMYAELLRPRLSRQFIRPGDTTYPEGWACSIVDDAKITHAHGMKEERIVATLEMVTSNHRMVWDIAVAENTKLQHQYTRIRPEKNCLGKSPNELDALAGCMKAWEHMLAMDPEKALKRADEFSDEIEIQRLQDFLRGKGRIKKPRPNWIRPTAGLPARPHRSRPVT